MDAVVSFRQAKPVSAVRPAWVRLTVHNDVFAFRRLRQNFPYANRKCFDQSAPVIQFQCSGADRYDDPVRNGGRVPDKGLKRNRRHDESAGGRLKRFSRRYLVYQQLFRTSPFPKRKKGAFSLYFIIDGKRLGKFRFLLRLKEREFFLFVLMYADVPVFEPKRFIPPPI